jgi:RHS repeat-associated protein
MKWLSYTRGSSLPVFISIIAVGGILAALPPDIIFEDSFENHPPEITSTPITAAQIDVPYAYDVEATDADGDLLLFGLVVAPDNMSIGELSGEINWTPNQLGVFGVEILVSDGNGGTAHQQWDIHVQAALDSDGDGLSDDEEIALGTDPDDSDTDDDELSDGEEVNQYQTDPLDADMDDDGLSDGDEIKIHFTQPGNPDTDNDTYRDGEEVGYGTDPLDDTDFPVNTVPADPADVAPEIDPTVATTVYESTEFLFRGLNRVQTGVANGVIEPEQVAVIRGKVMSRDGAPLSGVLVTVLHHPEFGQTLSRVDGAFDLVVNGGGYRTVNLAKDGYLPAQRQVAVPWQDWVWAPDVVLIPLDPTVTAVDLTQPGIQTARGSVVTDDRGTRQNTLLFPEGTLAEMVFPDGSTQPLSSLTLTATEYSTGEQGENAMPAQLPPGVGYTYCAELRVAEAADAGAMDVQFSQPVPNYLENFLGFPAGAEVPAYYYDQNRGLWVPSPAGRVIDIIGISGGLADLDTNGDGAVDDAPTLDALGISDAERAQLAGLYGAGDSVWRVRLEHFSTIDYNMPYNYPESYYPQTPSVVADQPCGATCNTYGSSTIASQNQTLGESVPIIATPFSLNYHSGRTPGRTASRLLKIPIEAQSCTETWLTITIGGRNFFETMPCSAEHREFDFVWDGLDAYGREATALPVKVRVSYVYPAFRCANKWNELSQDWEEVCVATPPAMDALASGTWEGVLVNGDARRRGFGGWTLDAHHQYDMAARQLNLGDGSTRTADATGQVVNKQASASGLYFQGFAVGPSGTLFLADTNGDQILKSSRGIQEVIAGNWNLPEGYNGDGIPATEASLANPSDVALGSDGSLYIADTANYRIRRVDSDGIIHTVAGDGTFAMTGDGGPAVDASIGRVDKIRFGPDGSLYMVAALQSFDTYRVRRISPDGIINTVYDPGSFVFGSSTYHLQVRGLAIGPDNSLYVALWACAGTCYGEGNHTVQRVWPDGTVDVLAGTGTLPEGFSGDGGPAVDAQLSQPNALALGSDGSVYISDSRNYRIRKVTPAGMISTIAGCGDPSDTCDTNGSRYGLLAASTRLGSLKDIETGPNGLNILSGPALLLGSALPGIAEGELMIPDQSGNRVFFFDFGGRHLRTVNSLTGAGIYHFRSNTDGLLASIADGNGNVTTVERGAGGNPLAIIGPFGQRTDLTVDANGYLATISNPAGETWQFGYTGGGLLTSAIDPNENPSAYTYDTVGRLTLAEDAAGGSQALARVEFDDAYEVTRTTGMGRTTTYRTEQLPSGDRRYLNTGPDGLSVESLIGSDGSQIITLPDGTTVDLMEGPDPRFGMQSPYIETLTVTFPSSLEALSAQAQSAVVEDAPLSVVNLTTSYTFAGATTEDVYTASTRTLLSTSPEGRTVTVTTDEQARPLQRSVPGLHPMTVTYDVRGRLESVSVGTDGDVRATTFAYAEDGFLDSVTDPLERTVGMERDPVGRLVRSNLPGGLFVEFDYDDEGNLLSLTPPGRPPHSFAYNARGYLTTSTPPAIAGTGPTGYSYDDDGYLTDIDLPGNETLTFTYDFAGRLGSLILAVSEVPVAAYDIAWNSAGLVDTVAGPGSQNLIYTYDGTLITGVQWTGPVAGDVTKTFDDALRISSQQINGGASVTYSWDDDDLLINVGELAISRDPDNGLPIATTLGIVSDTLDYDGFGFVTHYRAHANETTLYEVDFERDEIGNVIRKVEAVGGETHTYEYAYDDLGQLTQVKLDDVVVETYTYDDNGNRLSATVGGGTQNATYDDQDRLITHGAASFEYKPSGMLKRRTVSGSISDYSYDPLGNLLGVTLPSGTTITYLLDGADRRVGRQINGAPAERFLYEGSQPVAQLDAAGNVVSRFVYSGGYVPIYLVRDGVAYRILTDQTNSVRLVVNTITGNISQRLEYDAFGRIILDSNPGFQPFGFAGGLYDPETGLVQFGARDYDPTIGRWTAKDPTGFAGLDTNLYRYVFNNPVNLIDPSGLNSMLNISWGMAASMWDHFVDPIGGIARQITNGILDIYGIIAGVDVTPALQENILVSNLDSQITSSPDFWQARAICDETIELVMGVAAGGVVAYEAKIAARAAQVAAGNEAAPVVTDAGWKATKAARQAYKGPKPRGPRGYTPKKEGGRLIQVLDEAEGTVGAKSGIAGRSR